MIYRVLNYLLILVFLSLNACYSLSGISLSPEVKTARIATFPNFAPLQNPTLSLEFTNELQDIFDQRAGLNLTNDTGDIEIEGEITGYQQTVTTVVAGDQAAQNRLTITVKVRYQNNIDDEKSFEKDFSDFEDFDASQTLQQAEPTIVPIINERLTTQIFNAVAQDW